MLSVRLDEDLERHLNATCHRYGYSRSEAIKRGLTDWLVGLEPPPDVYQLGVDLFDKGRAVEPSVDLLRRRIWERRHEKYPSRSTPAF